MDMRAAVEATKDEKARSGFGLSDIDEATPGHSKAQACFAYLSDPSATAGAEGLLEDKSILDAFARESDLTILRYVVDSGRADGLPAVGLALQELLREKADRPDLLLLVTRIGCLAPSRAAREVVLDRIGACGLRVIEVSGRAGLGSGPTISDRVAVVGEAALPEAAARRRPASASTTPRRRKEAMEP